MSLTANDIRWVLIHVFVLLVAVALHEFGHAFMADRLGDDTPRRQGRVTLNPLAHADLTGTILLPIIGGIYAASGGVGGFGWGKPVQWQPARVDRKWRMATAQILVAIAGPAMNVILGTILAFVQVLLMSKNLVLPGSDVFKILSFAVHTNFVLFFFNLLPVPPLDGGHVVDGLLPHKHRAAFEGFARFGPFVVLAVAMIPAVAKIFLLPALFCARHVYLLFASLLGM